MSTYTCSACSHELPRTATFCPFCGDQRTGWVNPKVVHDFTPTAMISLPQTSPSRRQKVVATLAGLAVVGTIIGGVVVGSWLKEQLTSAESAVAQTAPAPQPIQSADEPAPRIMMVAKAPGGFDIVVADDLIHQIRTHEGSRYDSLAERQRAITVRLDHVAGKTTGYFEARAEGEHYEINWTDGTASFRLFDVTPADARIYGTDSVGLVANLTVDRMNEALEISRPKHVSESERAETAGRPS